MANPTIEIRSNETTTAASAAKVDMKFEIVGIVGDVKSTGITAPVPDEIYFRIRQFARILHPHRVNAHGAGHRREIGILQIDAGFDESRRLHLHRHETEHDTTSARSAGRPGLASESADRADRAAAGWAAGPWGSAGTGTAASLMAPV